MTALLIRRRRPIGEPAGLAPTAWPFAATLEGTAGAGRICQALIELSVPLDTVAQLVIDADVAPPELDAMTLDGDFDTVVLGSHLINVPDRESRRAFLRAAVRHARADGAVLVEHHPIDWADTAEPTTATPGADLGMDEVHRDPPFVSAVSTYDFGGHYVRQPFTARVLSEDELDGELAAAGLRRRDRLAPTWLRCTAAR